MSDRTEKEVTVQDLDERDRQQLEQELEQEVTDET